MSPEQLSEDEKKQIEFEINHIFESGANEIRIYDMVIRTIERRLAATQPQSAGEETGMRWVKASERVPDKSGMYHFRRSDDTKAAWAQHWNVKNINQEDWIEMGFEWLDESAATQTGATDWDKIDKDLHDRYGYFIFNESTSAIVEWFKSKLPTAQYSAKPEAPIDWEAIEKLAEHETEVQGWGKYEGVSEHNAIKRAFINGFKSRPELTQGQTGEGMAVGFAEWIGKKDFRLYGGKGWHNSVASDYFTNDELLALYKQSPEYKSIHDSKTD